MQAMVDGSRLLKSGNEVDSAIKDYMSLPKCYQAHSGLHDNCIKLCQQLSADLNADYPSLFSEKKYRELQNIAQSSQDSIVEQLKLQVKPIVANLKTAVNLSKVRGQLINKNWDEESKSDDLANFAKVIAFLGENVPQATFKGELTEAMKIATELDEKAKVKKGGAGKEGAQKK